MTVRRLWILIGVAGAWHNGLRLVAKILGAEWDYFNYLHPFHLVFDTPETILAVGILAVLGFVAWIATKEWPDSKGDKNTPYLESALWAIPTSVVGGGLALLVATTGEKSYGWVTFVLVPVIVGFQSVFVLARRTRPTLTGALNVAIVSIVCMGGLLVGSPWKD